MLTIEILNRLDTAKSGFLSNLAPLSATELYNIQWSLCDQRREWSILEQWRTEPPGEFHQVNVSSNQDPNI